MQKHTRIIGVAAAGALSMLWVSVVAAQRQPGRKLDLTANMLKSPLPPGDEAYGRIDGVRMKTWVDELTAIARTGRDAGDKYWGRIAGTKADALEHDWSAAKFRSLGLENVRIQEFALPPQWFPTSWEVTASGSGATLKPASVFPASRAIATPAAGLDLDAVWVGMGTEADFAGRDVKGKLAVIQTWPTDAPHAHSAAWLGSFKRAVEKGAAALLVNRATPGNFQLIGHNAAVPTMWIGTDDLNALRDLIAKGPVKVHFKLTTETRTGLKDANVWATLPGTTDEEIFIKAHHDGYFDAAMDNASGVATVIALAEYFSKIPKAQRRRTINFISVGGHHAGGDRNWMADPAHPIPANAALLINCEHTAVVSTMTFGDRLRRTTSIDPRRWTVLGSEQLAALTVADFTKFGVTLYEEMEGGGGDDDAPARQGRGAAPPRPSVTMSSINLIHSPQRFYHSTNDRPEVVPAAGLEAVARAFAKIVDDVNKLDLRGLRGARATSEVQ